MSAAEIVFDIILALVAAVGGYLALVWKPKGRM